MRGMGVSRLCQDLGGMMREGDGMMMVLPDSELTMVDGRWQRRDHKCPFKPHTCANP